MEKGSLPNKLVWAHGISLGTCGFWSVAILNNVDGDINKACFVELAQPTIEDAGIEQKLETGGGRLPCRKQLLRRSGKRNHSGCGTRMRP